MTEQPASQDLCLRAVRNKNNNPSQRVFCNASKTAHTSSANALNVSSRTRRSLSSANFGKTYAQYGKQPLRTSLLRAAKPPHNSCNAFVFVVASFLLSRRKDTFSSASSPLYTGDVYTFDAFSGLASLTGVLTGVTTALENAEKPMKPLAPLQHHATNAGTGE